MLKLFWLFLVASHIVQPHIQAAQAHVQQSLLSPEEVACFQWFEKTKGSINHGLKDLSPEDQEVFSKKTRYSDAPEVVIRATSNFAASFCKAATASNISLMYDAPTLASTLLKMKIAVQNKTIAQATDRTSARIYVFTQLLTADEQATVSVDNYKKNPEAAHQAMVKHGELLAAELAKLGLIEDTEQAKKQEAEQFTKDKIADLQQWHAPQSN